MRTQVTTGIRQALVSVILAAALPIGLAQAQVPNVEIVNDDKGSKMVVEGRDFMMFGMNWGYMPIGENYTYAFWEKPDDFIKDALRSEMELMKAMGVNTIRHYVGIPPRWVEYIYDTYGIYTVVNHTVGRYGLTLDGIWLPNTDYSDPKVREFIKQDVRALVEEFRGTRGMLMWLLGNENNYGLSWSSFEIEALPEGERNEAKAEYLYSLFGEVVEEIKAIDPDRPVCMANGDLQYIDIIAKYCQNLDVFGSNVYRGISARDFFQVVKDKLGVPTIFTEFGADAFNAVTMQEDQETQAKYYIGQWQEIYEQSYGKGRVGNAAGGMIFQWSDGWWKYRQEERLDIHDTNASWPNAGYPEDYREGDNNMNEEWWGICAKGPNNTRGIYEVYPRAAYYAMQEAFQLDPFAPDTDLEAIRKHFGECNPSEAALDARGDAAALATDALSKVRLSGVRMEFETYSTGGKNVTTPDNDAPQDAPPQFLGFDNKQSFYFDVEAKPNDGLVGRVSINVLGNVPGNPIDEIFYEDRGRPRTFLNEEGEPEDIDSLERVKVYQAELTWDDRWFQLDAFYRTGHLHWQYFGDYFGLYRDAFYGENLDIYNGLAPIGFQIEGKKGLRGLTLAIGPELWWGANPAIFAKYNFRKLGTDWTLVAQEDFTQRTEATSSVAIPVRESRKIALSGQRRLRWFDFEGGVLWSGRPRKGETFQLVDRELLEEGAEVDPEDIKEDRIGDGDTFGVKGKLSLQEGRWNWYGEGSYRGLVNEGGPTSVPTFTGWTLRDSGSGNQVHALTGVAVGVGGVWQLGPNFLWQRPLVGPMPSGEALAFTQGRPRNVLADPFAVLGNRETTGFEFILAYDPTPATWMWAWDSDRREDARFAASVAFKWRRHHTTADAGLFVADTGDVFAFGGGTPARDLWEVNSRLVNRFGDARMVSHIYFGQAEPRGDDPRLVERFGADTRVVFPRFALAAHAKFNDFGPYDYHRDFNFTFPLQLMGDVAYTLGTPQWFSEPETKLGIRGTFRTLDHNSPRYLPPGYEGVELLDGEVFPADLEHGNEWEIRTYLHLSM